MEGDFLVHLSYVGHPYTKFKIVEVTQRPSCTQSWVGLILPGALSQNKRASETRTAPEWYRHCPVLLNIPINTRMHILHTMLHTFPDVLIHSATTRTGPLGIDYPITKFFRKQKSQVIIIFFFWKRTNKIQRSTIHFIAGRKPQGR